MNFLELIISSVTLLLTFRILKSVIKYFKARKELNKLFMKY